ncbi:hypothetical protein BJ742DRAFT_477071 [Cladochytrium replicatum]|nr:hypothetical protein BJ742DRAFT_477071 [Cladochytrium replicatum]
MIKLAHDPLEKPIESDGHPQTQFQTTQTSPPAPLYHTDLTPYPYVSSSASQSPVQHPNHHLPGNYLLVQNLSALQPAAHQYPANHFVLLRPQPVLFMNNQSLAQTPTVNVTVASPGHIHQPTFVSPLRMAPSFSGFESIDEGQQITINRLATHSYNSPDWTDTLQPTNNFLQSPQISSAHTSPMYVFDPGTALNHAGQSQHTFSASEQINDGSRVSMLKMAKGIHMHTDHLPTQAMGSNLSGGVYRMNVPQFEIGSPTPGLSHHSPASVPIAPPCNWPALPASRKGSFSSVSNPSPSSMSPMAMVSSLQEGEPLLSWRPLAAEAAELGDKAEEVSRSSFTPKSEASREPSVESDFQSGTSVSNSSSPPPPVAKKKGRKKSPTKLTPGQQLKRKLRGLRAASKRNSPYYQVDPTTGERIFSCLICAKVYRNQNGLKYHLTHGHVVLDHSRAMEEIAKGGFMAHSQELDVDAGAVRESAASSSSSNSPKSRYIHEMAQKLVERSIADKEATDRHLEYLKKRGFEHRPFVCEEEGCGKHYKNAGGLKYHMEKHHPDVLSKPSRPLGRSSTRTSVEFGGESAMLTSQSSDERVEDHYSFKSEVATAADPGVFSIVKFLWLPAPEGFQQTSQTLPIPPGDFEQEDAARLQKWR